jgi:hypothetical protein
MLQTDLMSQTMGKDILYNHFFLHFLRCHKNLEHKLRNVSQLCYLRKSEKNDIRVGKALNYWTSDFGEMCVCDFGEMCVLEKLSQTRVIYS